MPVGRTLRHREPVRLCPPLRRVGDFQEHPIWGTLLDQLW